MTVSTTITRNNYTANGATTVFAYTFRVLSQTDLKVYLVDAEGVETLQTFGTHYTVTGIGAQNGGNVTFIAAVPASGLTVSLRRELPLTQPTDYKNQGRFNALTHETSFDRATMLVQQVADGLARVPQQPGNGLPWYDAQGNRIINVGDPIGAQDAVNLQTMQDFVGSATGSLTEPQTWQFVGDGTTTAFAIPGATIANPAAYQASIDGLLQRAVDDYTISLTLQTMTFDAAPPTGAVIFVRALGFAAPASAEDWNAGGFTITNVGPPTSPTDAATRGYVDTVAATLAPLTHTHAATDIVSGFMDPDRLGTGTRTGAKFLRDDGSWQDVSALAGLPFTSRGDIVVFDGSSNQRLPVGTDGYTIVADSNEPLGIRWAVNPNSEEAIQDIVGAMGQTTATVAWTYDDPNGRVSLSVVSGGISTTQLADSGVTTAKIVDANITTAKLADGAVTTAKLGDAAVTVAKISATGTADGTTVLRGDGTWAAGVTGNWAVTGDITGASLTASVAASNIDSGIIDPARLGSGLGGITPGEEANYFLNAAGNWTSAEALYDGTVVASGSAPGGGGAFSNEAAQDAVGSILLDTATIDFTYDDAGPSISADVKAGSIGLTQINTVSLDTRYALVGSGGGSLPSGGTTATFLRGDGTWASEIVNPAFPTLNLRWTNQGFIQDAGSGFVIISRGGADSTTDNSGSLAFNQRGDSWASWKLEIAKSSAGHQVELELFRDPGAARGEFRVGALANPANMRVTGDHSVDGAGAFTGALTAASFTGAIAATNINSGIIAAARLGSGSPSSSTYLRGDGAWATIPSGSAITVSDSSTIDLTLSGGGVLSADLVDLGISAGKIATSAVTEPKIATNAVTFSKIADGNVTESKIANGSVTVNKIGASAVTAVKIQDGAVSTTKLANGGVTPAKLQAVSGTPSATTFYRGDGVWATPTGSGSVDQTAAYNWTGLHAWNVNATATTSAMLSGTRTCAPGNDRAGTMFFTTNRTGGQQQNANMLVYDIQAAQTTGFDICLTSYVVTRDCQGGAVFATWDVALSPSSSVSGQNWTGGGVLCSEMNFGNRWADFGLLEDRRLASRFIGAIQIVPDVVGGPDSHPSSTQYHASYGLIFAASGVGAKMHIPIYIEENSTAPGGYMHKWWGGSSAALGPSKLAKVQGNFDKGIDFSAAVMNSTNKEAITLAAGMSVEFGGGRIWYDSGTSKMKVYDPTGGTRDL